MRDHEGVNIETFNGLFQRGDPENTPMDHFQASNNLKHRGQSVMTRDGISISQDVNIQPPLQNIVRIYNYPTLTANTLIILTYDRNTDIGNIYHYIDEGTVFGPILTITGMKDFAFQPYAGRGYISPFASLPPTLVPPAIGPALAVALGTGVTSGSHNYAVTFINSEGETTPGPQATISTQAALANPTITLVANRTGIGDLNNVLANGGTYTWKVTYLNAQGEETLPSSASTPVITNDGSLILINPSNTAIPSGVVNVNIYRTTNGGATYYKEQQVTAAQFFTFSGTTVGHVSDAAIVSNPTAPGSNNTQAYEQIQLSNIPIGGTGVTSRKIYRTTAGGTQLKLLTTLADNVTTSFLDTVADGSLGVNAPTENTAEVDGDNIERGLQGEFLYVYAGDGTNARKAAGAAITGSITVAATTGHTDAGLHIYGVVSETVSGYLSPPGALTTFTNIANRGVSFGNIPTSGDPNVVRRHIVASKAITNFNGDTEGYQLFFIPNATINNNTDTFLNNVSFYDADLLDDASHLFDNYSEIPAGAVLTLYHNRLVLASTFDDFNLAIVSAIGEPEAISQVDGLLAVQPDGNPVSNAAEYRDVLYVFKPSRTMSFTDNGDEPATWPLIITDAALGTRPHGIATVLDSGNQNVDFLIVATYQGVTLFTGSYQVPELSWKIEQFWRDLNKSQFGKLQIINNPIKKRIYIVLPDRYVLVGFYQIGMNPKDIQWEPWTFVQPVNTMAIVNKEVDILGCDIY